MKLKNGAYSFSVLKNKIEIIFILIIIRQKQKMSSELEKKIALLEKEIQENEAVERYIMDKIKKGCKYEDLLKAYYREGKVVNGKWIDDDDE